MSPHPDEQQQDVPLEVVEDQPAPEARRGGVVTGLVGWVVSAALHATVMMIMGAVYFLIQDPGDGDTPPIKISTIQPPPPKPIEQPRLKRDLNPTVEIEVTAESPVTAPLTALEVVNEEFSREEEKDSPVPKGREEAVADIETGSTGAFLAIGANSGGSGMLGNRNGGGRRRAVCTSGGSQGSENAVEASLRWFRRHQSPNGSWEGDRYFQNCTEAAKCEPGSLEGMSAETVNTALTGYALLCYLGAGSDHKTLTKYRPVVKKGIDYLLSIQKPDGLLGERNYEHPIATMALAEAYAMSGDIELRAPAQKAVDVILKRQNQDANAPDKAYAGLGWDYVNPGIRNDASVTGWNIMALKSAFVAGLNTGSFKESGRRWLELSWKANNDGKEGRPDWQKLDLYQDASRFSYVYPTGATGFSKDFGHQNMAPVGLVCAVFLGHTSGDPMLETLANFVMKEQVPKAYPTNTYYLYYNTLGMFQVNGKRWETWNGRVRDLLVDAQRRGEGCLDGSWDWEGTGFHGHKIGRVLSTAYNCLSLEVYYRFALVNNLPKPGERVRGHH